MVLGKNIIRSSYLLLPFIFSACGGGSSSESDTSAESSVAAFSATFESVSSKSEASGQTVYYIVHKPTGHKMQVCDGPLGKPVTSRPNSNEGPC